MKSFGHLTKEQLEFYAAHTAGEREESRAIGRHLLECAECRNLLANPRPEQFMSALLSETSVEVSPNTKSSASEKTKYYFPFGFFWQPKFMAVGAGAFVIALCFSIFVWLNGPTGSGDGEEIVQIMPVQPESSRAAQPIPSPERVAIPPAGSNSKAPAATESKEGKGAQSPVKTSDIGRKNSQKRNIEPGTVSLDPAREIKISRPFSNSGRINNVIVSESRSLNNCPPGKLDFIVSPYYETITEKQPVLRWKPVPESLKYEIYVSDASQSLVEKVEITAGNSYKLKAVLEMGKAYRWKVIATLADDKTLSSDSIDFAVGSSAQKYSREKIGRMNVNPTRCLQ